MNNICSHAIQNRTPSCGVRRVIGTCLYSLSRLRHSQSIILSNSVYSTIRVQPMLLTRTCLYHVNVSFPALIETYGNSSRCRMPKQSRAEEPDAKAAFAEVFSHTVDSGPKPADLNEEVEHSEYQYNHSHVESLHGRTGIRLQNGGMESANIAANACRPAPRIGSSLKLRY